MQIIQMLTDCSREICARLTAEQSYHKKVKTTNNVFDHQQIEDTYDE